MSIFKNINFLNEARTKEEYLAQKQKENKEKEEAEQKRFDRRYGGDMQSSFRRSFEHGSVGNKYDTKEYLSDDKHSWNEPGYMKKFNSDHERSAKAHKELRKKLDSMPNDDTNILTKRGRDAIKNSNLLQAADAKNRHMRRHPEQYEESVIFNSINFIN